MWKPLQLRLFFLQTIVCAGAICSMPLLRAESVADEPTDESTYLDEESCISLRAVKRHEILDSQHIVFEMRGQRYFLNTTRQPCHAMRRNRLVSFTASGARLCSLDPVKVLERSVPVDPIFVMNAEEAAGFRVVGTCALGSFEAISKDQFEALRDSLQSSKKNKVEPAAVEPEGTGSAPSAMNDRAAGGAGATNMAGDA